MLTGFRRLILDTFIYGGGDFILRSTALLTMPVYTRIFSPEDYGVWSYIGTLVGLYTIVVALGGTTVSNRFFFDAKDTHRQRVAVSTWLIFIALWTSAISLGLVMLARSISSWSFQTDGYESVIVLSVLTVPLTQVNLLCGQVLRDQFQAKRLTALNLMATSLTIGMSLFAVLVLDLGLTGLAAGAFASAAIMLPLRLWTARSMLRMSFSFSLLKPMLHFGIPLVATGLAYWIFNVSDTVMLGHLSTFDQVGLYAVAAKVNLVLVLLTGAFGQAWVPHALSTHQQQPELTHVFFGRVLIYMLVVFGGLGVLIITFTSEILVILTSPEFYPAAAAVTPLVLAGVATASTQVTSLGIYLVKKTHFLTPISAIAALFNVGLNFLLIPQWGMVAAGWTTFVAYWFLTSAYLYVSQRLWPINCEYRKLATVTGLVIIFGVVAPSLPEMGLLFTLILKLGYCGLYILMLFICRVLGHLEWEGLRTLWKQTQSRLHRLPA